jgi:hypothetical protein
MIPSLVFSLKQDISHIVQRFDYIYAMVGGANIHPSNNKVLARLISCVLSGDLIESRKVLYVILDSFWKNSDSWII